MWPAFDRAQLAKPDTVIVCQAGVGDLLNTRRPPDIAWFVVAVVVNAVKRQVWMRSIPHRIVECHEALAPFIADVNAAPAVVSVFGVLGIVAALNDGPPERVFRAGTHVMGSFPGLAAA